jgi:cytochrome c553
MKVPRSSSLRGIGAIKQAIRERDGLRCSLCGLTNEEHLALHGTSLEVHRTVPGSLYTLDEGACKTLCRRCHGPQPRRPRGAGQPDLAYGEPLLAVRLPRDIYDRLQATAEGLSLKATSLLRLMIRQTLPAYESQAEEVRRRESQEDCP